jgi:peptidyl-prolyl cis-trans isomerase-like 3
MSLTIKTTLGDIKIELFCAECPRTCKNFLALCASGYYNNTLFHRSIKGFIVQGGDPTGTGKGGESIYGRFFEDEIAESLTHSARGIVSMANKGKPNTNGSQFFITYAKHAHLDHVNTVFGRVIHGMDTLDAIERVRTDEKDRPLQEIKILSVTIHANPLAEEE